MQYEIYEGNMERLKSKLTRIANKCKKYGCDFHFVEVGETFKAVKDDNGILHDTRFVIVEAEGKAKINDWEFAATVDHTEAGNIITGYGLEIPERYYHSACVCEHCNSRRYRKETYIVHNTVSGEFKQVGKSCLTDYTHGLSAEAVAHYLSFFDTLAEYEAPDSTGGFTHYLDKMDYLVFAAETIRCFGYVKRNQSEYDTASRAMDCRDAYYHRFPSFMKEFEEETLSKMDKAGFNPERTETIELVKSALEWVKNQEESSNYIHNLKTACALDYIKHEHYGLLASLFPAYNRELEYQAKREREKKAEQVSNYVGEIKQRLTVKILSCKAVASWETDFGTTKIYKMVDEAGNIFIWKTGTWIEEESFTITGTVKEHNEFHGIKQTELTRCRIQAA